MTQTDTQSHPTASCPPGCEDQAPFVALKPLAARLADLERKLHDHLGGEDPARAKKARRLLKMLKEFEPSVTLIGQVKAGKTTLVNSLIGWPGLLPADVNPWTSVVTSAHLGPQSRRMPPRSSFRFFSNQEWDNLTNQGGRIGEIARRAGAADEMAKVQEQLQKMREKSRHRLGRRFEMLLGQTHSYETLNAELIKRYVCMGDDFWDTSDVSQETGRFADITKSADLWFSAPNLPLGLCIQDTPGVNDTFLIREQITLNALRTSRLCVVVLSAQQALSSVDMGLIRLISNVKARDTLIFVNRIDELGDPARDVPQIRQSIRATLEKHDGPRDAQVIFGSAYWAQHAINDTLHQLGEQSAAALLSWAKANLTDQDVDADPRALIWTLSGIPSLGQAVATRIESGVASELIAKLENDIGNLETSRDLVHETRALLQSNRRRIEQSKDQLAGAFEEIKQRSLAQLDAEIKAAGQAFVDRAQNARITFLDRATDDLLKHLKTFGENEIWSYDPVGLRMLLRSAYQMYAKAAAKSASRQLDTVGDEISALLATSFDLDRSRINIGAAPIPNAEPPVSLAKTIALDLKGSWWSRFWRSRRGYDAFAQEFSELIHEETTGIYQELREQFVDTYYETLRRTLVEFIDDQRRMVLGMADQVAAPQRITPLDGVA